MDSLEKIEKRRSELLDELEKTKPGDPNFKYITDNIKTLTESEVAILKEDNTRLNNNECNDINRMKVEVEHNRVKVEKLKVEAGLLSDVIDGVKTGVFCWIAYNGDKVSYAIRSIFDVAKGYMKQRRRY